MNSKQSLMTLKTNEPTPAHYLQIPTLIIILLYLCRALITNLTCPGDSSLYVEWAQPEKYFHGVDMYNLFIKTRLDQEWTMKQVVVPPVAKHNVEKVTTSLLLQMDLTKKVEQIFFQ